MNDILKEFYRGNLSPGEKMMVRGSKMSHISDELTELENQLTKELPPELQQVFSRLLAAQASLVRITAEEHFIDGFKTGSRFMLAVCDDRHENIKPVTD